MIKLVVSDMDGTLLNSDELISEKNLEAIKRVRDKGIIFTVATGRSEQLMKEYVDDLGLVDSFIMCNGALIGHPFKEENLYAEYLTKEDVRGIVDISEQFSSIYMIYTKYAIYSKPNHRRDHFEKRNRELPLEKNVIFKDIDDIEKIIDENDIYKVLIVENRKEVNEKLHYLVSQNEKLNVVTSQKGFVDINPVGMSKGNALKILMDYYNVSLDEVVVFGDQDNDVSMLELIPNSVCMENGSEMAKKAGKHRTLSNNDSGVAAWLNEYIKKID